MDARKLLDSISDTDSSLDQMDRLLDRVLPPQTVSYKLDDIDIVLRGLNDDFEKIQRSNNDKFDVILDDLVRERLLNLSQALHETQLSVMKLQCNIAYAKEQHDTVKRNCNSQRIHEHYELLQSESRLRADLQKSKFKSVLEFLDLFIAHLNTSISACRTMLAHHASNYLQSFDWAYYHQTMFLLRACGKTIMDINMLERLYQSDLVSFGLVFKQPIERIDLNNFIEFQTSFSLESQLSVLQNDQHQDLELFLSNAKVQEIVSPLRPVEFQLFNAVMEKIGSTTTECCRLMIDLNLNYIEAHFTDGINIDKLNGCDTNATFMQPNEQALPTYAFSPQEYITQIGQHLLTLRKQTEQFDQIDSAPHRLALESLEKAQDIPLDVKSCRSVTEIILKCIARHCIRSLMGRSNKSILSKLTANGKRQLGTDAMYLDNVLEDLGLLDASDPQVIKFKSLFNDSHFTSTT